MGSRGTPVLVEHEVLADPNYFGTHGWVVSSERGPVAQYPPGTALIAAPFYALAPGDAPVVPLYASNAPELPPVPVKVPSLMVAAAVAAGLSASAMALLALCLLQIGWGPRDAIVGAYITGLGTSAWSVAGDALWQHGPAMFWIALGLWMASLGRWGSSGVATGLAFLTRPVTGTIIVALGLVPLLEHRWGRAFRFGAAAGLGGIALLTYNWWLFGELTLSGGYSEAFIGRLRDPGESSLLTNVVGGLFDPLRGLLRWSPWLALALLSVRRGWQAVPAWARAAALGALLYLLIQYTANRYSGGAGFLFYRYPLEPLTAAAPVLLSSSRVFWASVGNPGKLALAIAIVFSIGAHGWAAVVT